jgi:hypothetical protein
MAKVGLLHNVIVNGKHLARGTLVEETELTEHLRNNPQVVTRELDEFAGLCMALVPIMYHEDVKRPEGGLMSFPVSIGQGETFNPSDVAKRRMATLVEGQDYTRSFTKEDQARLRNEQTERELQFFQPDRGPKTYAS